MITRTRPVSSSRRAFTLIEVMISIALVLVLIVGINQVFKVAADTVGTGQALSAKVRDAKAVQQVFYNELSHAVIKSSDAPFFIIDSRTQVAFRDVRDQQGDLDFPAATTPAQQIDATFTRDLDGNNVEGENNIPGERSSPAAVNDRAHRVDSVSFFARDLYPRQTGSGYQQDYVADMSSSEAWITYGHGRVFNQKGNIDTDTDYIGPGLLDATNNPKNYYASDWPLLRTAMLLKMPDPPLQPPITGVPTRIFDHVYTPPAPIQQHFWMRMQPNTNDEDIERLEPLGRRTQVDNSQATRSAAAGAVTITDARYDLAGTTIADMRRRVVSYLDHVGSPPQKTPAFADAWWDVLPCCDAPLGELVTGSPRGRFRCNPYPTGTITPLKAAQTSGVLLSNCTQFIVEYAGDFIRQDNDSTPTNTTYGDIVDVGGVPATAFEPDGTIDFFLDRTSSPGATIRKVRWYGFPRDVNGDGIILGSAAITTHDGKQHNTLVDVVPLRDVMQSFTTDPTLINGMSFERIMYKDASPSARTIRAMPARRDYANPVRDTAPLDQNPDVNKGLSADNHYTCAWGPNDLVRPKMLRLVIRIDDPGGKLSGGQTYEYVINLP